MGISRLDTHVKHSRQTPYTIRYASSLTIKLAVLFSTHASELNRLYNVGSADGTAYSGAPTTTRTPDLMITNQLLYQLSYKGETY